VNPETDKWITYFQNQGYFEIQYIATGMEGAVYSLIPGEIVAKIWSRRSKPTLQNLQRFYNKISNLESSIRTPKILEIFTVDGDLISKEQFLQGIPLSDLLEKDAQHCDKKGLQAIIAVLKFLNSIYGSEDLRQL
jgi:hypothetical protein